MRSFLLVLLAAPAVAIERGVPSIPTGKIGGVPGLNATATPGLKNLPQELGLRSIPTLPPVVVPNSLIVPSALVPGAVPMAPNAVAPEGAPMAIDQARAAIPRFHEPGGNDGDDQKGALDSAFDGSNLKPDDELLPHVEINEAYSPFVSGDQTGNPVIVPDHLKPLLPGEGFDKATWNGRVTLHLHSVYSDGILSPEEVVQLAYDNGVRVLSLTEHDTTASSLRAYRKAKELGMEYHPGVEISAQGGAHIGAIDVDVTHPALVAMLAGIRDNRLKKAALVVAKLNEHPDLIARGITLTLDEVVAMSKHDEGGTVERPHVARVLLKHGLVSSVDEAFEKYLKGLRTTGKVPPDPAPKEIIDVVHAAGGKAIINHPYTVSDQGDDAAEKLVRKMAAQGLDGIEVYRRAPGKDPAQRKQADERAARWLMVADDYNLLVAPGSDFHGDDTHLSRPSVWMPNVLADQLRRRLKDSNEKALEALDRLDKREPPSPAMSAAIALAASAMPAAEAVNWHDWGVALAALVVVGLAFAAYYYGYLRRLFPRR